MKACEKHHNQKTRPTGSKCGKAGRKMGSIKRNPALAKELNGQTERTQNDSAADFGKWFHSIKQAIEWVLSDSKRFEQDILRFGFANGDKAMREHIVCLGERALEAVLDFIEAMHDWPGGATPNVCNVPRN